MNRTIQNESTKWQRLIKFVFARSKSKGQGKSSKNSKDNQDPNYIEGDEDPYTAYMNHIGDPNWQQPRN